MRLVPERFCSALLAAAMMLAPSMASSQVLVIDTQLNGAVAENNRLLSELLNENLTLSHYTSNLLDTVGSYRNFALDDIRYPSDLMTPRILEQFGLDGYNHTILISPLAAEAFVENYILTDLTDVHELSDDAFEKKYGQSKDVWLNVSKNRQSIASREAVLEGYAIAYAARMKSAATGSFIQDELRARARQSTSIREDLAVENLALAEIVGQLGTLVAVAASSLEIDAITSLSSSNF
jgi:hypothetical protein